MTCSWYLPLPGLDVPVGDGWLAPAAKYLGVEVGQSTRQAVQHPAQ